MADEMKGDFKYFMESQNNVFFLFKTILWLGQSVSHNLIEFSVPSHEKLYADMFNFLRLDEMQTDKNL